MVLLSVQRIKKQTSYSTIRTVNINVIVILVSYPISQADAMQEKIGYPDYILNDTLLLHDYEGVSLRLRFVYDSDKLNDSVLLIYKRRVLYYFIMRKHIFKCVFNQDQKIH